MRDFVELGSAPCDEPCAQLGSNDYVERARAECAAYIDQLKRHYVAERGGPIPEGLYLRMKGNQHDFGHYYEVVASFDDWDESALGAAYWLEANSPTKWDEIASDSIAVKQ